MAHVHVTVTVTRTPCAGGVQIAAAKTLLVLCALGDVILGIIGYILGLHRQYTVIGYILGLYRR